MSLGIREIIELTVPQYLLISILSPIAAYMILVENVPSVQLLSIIAALSLVVLGFNTLNMLHDIEIDALNKPRRPLPSGRTSKAEAQFLVILLYLLGFITSLTVNMGFVLLILLFAFVSAIYCIPPIRIRRHWWGSSLTGGALYGAIPFLSVETITGVMQTKTIFLIFFIALLIIVSNIKDFEDMLGEKISGVTSLTARVGEKKSAQILIVGNLLLLGGVGWLALVGYISERYLVASGIGLSLLLVMSLFFAKEVKELIVKNLIMDKLKLPAKFDYVFHSNATNIGLIYLVLIQLIFGILSLK